MPIWEAVNEGERKWERIITELHPNHHYSARNFLRYLQLRTFDLRKLQKKLTMLGLSSISHSERHVLANIENILYLLHFTRGEQFKGRFPFGEHPVNFEESRKKLKKNAQKLFKSVKKKNDTHIMVTLPSEAVSYDLVHELMLSGMEIARINCSHDDDFTWAKMVANIHQAKAATGYDCAIYFDLAGPKLRTGEVGKNGRRLKDRFIHLEEGDVLELHRNPVTGRNRVAHKKGKEHPARISFSLPEVFDALQPHQRIWFDDGAIAGVITEKKKEKVWVTITRVSPKGGKLRGEKGINLPDTDIHLPSLTQDDLDILPFIVENADIVGYSFVRTEQDVAMLQEELARLGGTELGLILKIENKEAFENLPSLILQAMKSPHIGVMTARGDLSVELGSSRLSEVQEEIMWLCEAAFIPNIWATQVLESLAKKGIASRAEITDAAMAARTECVMLNKGKYIIEAVKTLKSITNRMSFHQNKKQGTMRRLNVAEKACFELDRKSGLS